MSTLTNRVRNRSGGGGGSFLLKGILGISRRKDCNGGGISMLGLRGGQNVEGGLGIREE